VRQMPSCVARDAPKARQRQVDAFDHGDVPPTPSWVRAAAPAGNAKAAPQVDDTIARLLAGDADTTLGVPAHSVPNSPRPLPAGSEILRFGLCRRISNAPAVG
jgi:hypothetical protein